MVVTTGFGYYVKDGKRIRKYELPKGRHSELPEGIIFIEVASKEELDQIVLDKPPELELLIAEDRKRMEKRKAVLEKFKSIGFTEEDIKAMLG